MEEHVNSKKDSRRAFVKKTAFACTGFPFLTRGMASPLFDFISPKTKTMAEEVTDPSIIGLYGQWAAGLVENPAELSFRKKRWMDLNTWKPEALGKVNELVAMPKIRRTSDVRTLKTYSYDGLDIEEISWQLSNGGPETKAIVLKPKGAKGPLPGILALHDHGGNKYFGKRKITRVSDDLHPMMKEHQKQYYEDRAWANEIAKKGYLVLVHDTFAFGSRRVKYENIAGITWGDCSVTDKTDKNPEDSANIDIYNDWAGYHEHILSKSLFSAGTTWPGVTLAEDREALDVLSARADVDADNVGCAGLSGGGLRTVYLGGLDERIKCAVCVGFMTTWNDLILHKSFTHTWMTYTPLVPKYLEFPEILGLRVPLPVMVQNNRQDGLFTLSEMEKSDILIKEIYAKAGAPGNYLTKFYEGPHKFDAAMQADAFEWFDKWLKK